MKRYGSLVVKPDALNPHDLSIVLGVLQETQLNPTVAFSIDNYVDTMESYRKADIQFKDFANAEVEIKGCNAALRAYKQLYGDSKGLLLLIKFGDKDPQ